MVVESPGVSVAPDGTAYPLPADAERAADAERLSADAQRARAEGRQVVAVQGLGFVGVAVAACVAAARDEAGRPRCFVIGVDLPTPASYWRVRRVAEGTSPMTAPDPDLPALLRDGALVTGNLRATTCEEAYGLADVIIVDVPLHVPDRVSTEPAGLAIDQRSFEEALRAVGRRMRPDALVLMETTVPAGFCEQVAAPLLQEERMRRGIETPLLLAYAPERVMPGPRYVESIRRFWRAFAGIDRASTARARAFLSSFIDTTSHPLSELADPTSAELVKLLENSYRAANIAFIHEWTLLAEQLGVNLFAVIEAIRVRTGTHDNIRNPGFGVGGYCLTKDSLLAQWSATHLFGTDVVLRMTLDALRINHEMPLHTLSLTREVLGGSFAKRRVAVCGISYLPGVGDTRWSPAEIFVDRLLTEGAIVVLHDPYVPVWPERPDLSVGQDLATALHGADALVLAVPHAPYRVLSSEALTRMVGRPAALVDAQNVVDDETAATLRAAEWRLAGVGKGHWRTRRYQCTP